MRFRLIKSHFASCLLCLLRFFLTIYYLRSLRTTLWAIVSPPPAHHPWH
jgi:hypothetical protein